MASLDADGYSQGHSIGHHKITKTRNRSHVKPILKKLHSNHSDKKDSLDLDRSWEEQPTQYFQSHSSYDQDSSYQTTRAARDVSFTLSATDLGLSSSSTADVSARRRKGAPVVDRFSHARSTSGASHASVATSNSGRTATFVHPRQQMPRTSTPPLSQSYGNTFGRSSLDYNFGLGSRDFEYSTTINEDMDDSDDILDTTATPSTTTPALTQYSTQLTNYSTSSKISSHLGNGNGTSLSSANNTAPGRSYNHHRQYSGPSGGVKAPSLASQRTSSLSDVTSAQPSLRVNTKASGTSPRIISTVSHGRPEDGVSPAIGSPDGGNGTLQSEGAFGSPSFTYAPHSSSTTPVMAQVRSSLDMGGFRLRSKSSLDAVTRQEQVRAARRKFEEKERSKEEKYERERSKKRERADTKEAQRQLRSGSLTGLASGRTSSSIDIRPALSRRSTSNIPAYNEKNGETTLARGYDEVMSGQKPEARGADGVQFATTPRKPKARAKNSGWTAFMLWFRTRLLKLGRR